MSTNVKTQVNESAASSVIKAKFTTDAFIGSGWQNGDERFINISFDRNVNFEALAAELKAGKSISIIRRKSLVTSRDGREFPNNKFVVALRSRTQ